MTSREIAACNAASEIWNTTLARLIECYAALQAGCSVQIPFEPMAADTDTAREIATGIIIECFAGVPGPTLTAKILARVLGVMHACQPVAALPTSETYCLSCRGEGYFYPRSNEATSSQCKACDGTGYESRTSAAPLPLPAGPSDPTPTRAETLAYFLGTEKVAALPPAGPSEQPAAVGGAQKPTLEIIGTVCQVGELDGENGALGIIIRRAAESFVTVKGLTIDETRTLCIEHFVSDIGVSFAAPSAEATKPLTRCAAGRDGDCTHPDCPQLRDNEPKATGRHCPLDTSSEDE